MWMLHLLTCFSNLSYHSRESALEPIYIHFYIGGTSQISLTYRNDADFPISQTISALDKAPLYQLFSLQTASSPRNLKSRSRPIAYCRAALGFISYFPKKVQILHGGVISLGRPSMITHNSLAEGKLRNRECTEEIVVARLTQSTELFLRASFFESPRFGWPWKSNLIQKGNRCLSSITLSDKGQSPIKLLPFKEENHILSFHCLRKHQGPDTFS